MTAREICSSHFRTVPKCDECTTGGIVEKPSPRAQKTGRAANERGRAPTQIRVNVREIEAAPEGIDAVPVLKNKRRSRAAHVLG
ncbi:MAG TPA: hypothetical protein VHS78_07515 [Candidatus Elarobacter sp.]|jgi:hypothetical protein|nr:hypothetical protein [Candidatus Elarobacter sp.]